MLVACDNIKTKDTKIFPKILSDKSIKYDVISMDTLTLFDTTSSFIGRTFVDNCNIYFADQFFNYVYEFDTYGRLRTRYLGSGKSDKELYVGYFCGASMFENDGRTVFLGNQIDIHLYDTNFVRIKSFQLPNYFSNQDTTNLYNLPKTYSYPLDNFVIRGLGDYLYLNLMSESPKLNSIEFAEKYYKNAHPIMKIGLNNNTIEELLWNFPPAYSKTYSDKGILFHVLFDIDKNGNFYINCEGDSTIYTYNKEWKPMRAYGYQGREMDTDYPKVYTFNAANAVWEETRMKGIYQWLEYIDDTGLLFRTYSKSEKADTWGMQIFSDNKIIADVDVPIGLKVKGYIAPYYYGEIIADPDTRTMKILRFKLD